MVEPISAVDFPSSANPKHAILVSDFDPDAIPLDPFVFSSTKDDGCGFDDDLSMPLPLDADFDLDAIFNDANVHDMFLDLDESDGLAGNFDYDPDNNSAPESGVSGDRGSEVEGYLNCSMSGSGSCDSGVPGNSSSPDVSQVSRNDGMSVPSPESGNCLVEENIKIEEDFLVPELPKRKNEIFENHNEEVCSKKSRNSGNNNFTMSADNITSPSGEGEDKRKARLMRNRESAQLSRQRKKHYVEELEEKVRAMHSTISDLNCKVSFFMAENASLKQQLSGNGMCPAPVYPPPMAAPIPYPWVPLPPYVVKPQGSQVPLVPIPRLKPQQASPVKKNSEGEKIKGKRKKVASMVALSMLSICLFFGGFLDHGNQKGDNVYTSDRSNVEHRGRILMANKAGFINESFTNKRHWQWNSQGCSVGRKSHNPDEYNNHSNGNEPLFASLYVPRNDKLVKIDGNLIIHSVLATDKAMEFQNKTRENGPLIRKDPSPSLALPDPTARADNQIQQWFREGLAEPLLSSGMCTEVYQFNVSPSPGAIVSSDSQIKNTKKMNSRRALHSLPAPKFNYTGESFQRKMKNSNKSATSTVVSVLIDPRETGEMEVDGIIRSKSLSRIFVVVLLDSVKYVTYSCRLPHVSPNLVTT